MAGLAVRPPVPVEVDPGLMIVFIDKTLIQGELVTFALDHVDLGGGRGIR